MPIESKYETQKVNPSRLSKLARWILLNASDGIERGQITGGFFEIERLYCGWYVDPCYGPKERLDRTCKNSKAQSLTTKTLCRLEQLGLVRLVRRKRYVKAVELTQRGKAVAQELNQDMICERTCRRQ